MSDVIRRFLSLDIDPVFLFLAGSAVVKLTFVYFKGDKRPPGAKLVGHVTGLTLYPAKSMKGIRIENADCTHVGIRLPGTDVYDRCWLVTFGEEHRFVTARQEPTLLFVQPSFQQDQILFDAPSMEETLHIPLHFLATEAILIHTRVWGEDVDGLDCGDDAARWISHYLGGKHGHRLIYHNPIGSIMKTRTAWSFRRKPAIFQNSVKSEDKLSFHDDGPYLLTTEASLADLNTRLQDAAVPMETFRPSIIVDADRPAFEEDKWTEIYIGENVKFSTMMPCARCMLTSIDHISGHKRDNNEPLNTMKSYRKILKSTESPCFGTYLVCDRQGQIHLDDPVYVLLRE